MVAFPGSFPYLVLLNLDVRDLWYWAKRGVKVILGNRLNELRTTRLANDDGNLWTEEVNSILRQLQELDQDEKTEKEKKEKQASGWDFFKQNPIG
jgi:hypothetical protein